MTDITDPTAGIGEAWERGVAGPLAEFLTVFARGIAARPDVYSDDLVNSARAVLATVEAPAPTLAEELRHIAEHWEEWATDTITSAIRAAADRAEQIEQERDREKAISKGWMEAHQKLAEHHAETLERDEARAEVERLAEALKQLSERVTARLPMPPGDIPGTALPINISAIVPDPTTPNPADVKPGEAWLVEVNGKRGTALKDGGGLAPWSVVINGVFTSRCDEFITLVARLVPEPRTVRYEPKEK